MWNIFWKAQLVKELLSFDFWIFSHFVTIFRNILKNITRCSFCKATELFQKFFHIYFYHVMLFLNYFICFAITWILNFTVNLVTSFSRQKLLKSKIKLQHTIFLEYKVLPSCKVWVHTNKKCRGSSKDAYPGYQRFFSRAAGSFGVGRRPTRLRP